MPAQMPQILFAIAGLGCLVAALAHSILGERLFVPQIRSGTNWAGGRNAAEFKNSIVRLAWHATSVMWAGFAAILLAQASGYDDTRTFCMISSTTFGVLLLMTGPATSWRHVGWPVFAVITASLAGAAVIAG